MQYGYNLCSLELRLRIRRSHKLNLAMLLREWPVPWNDDCSGSNTNTLMAATEAVEIVQKDCEQLECKAWKRKSSKHYYIEAMKTAIRRYAEMHGKKRAVFSEFLSFHYQGLCCVILCYVIRL